MAAVAGGGEPQWVKSGTSHLEQAPSAKPRPIKRTSRAAAVIACNERSTTFTPSPVSIYAMRCHDSPSAGLLQPPMCLPSDWQGIGAKFRLSYRRREPGTVVRLQRSAVGPVEETTHGNSSERLGAVAPRAGRIIHRYRLAGPDHRGAGAGAGAFGPRAFRARRAHPLAYPSARADAVCRLGHAAGCRRGAGRCAIIRGGDVVWIPPEREALARRSPNTVMVHVAMQEALDGKHVTWMEPVTDEQYKAAVG